MTTTVGALCVGYGGLELALHEVLPDAELVWYSEVEPSAIAIMEAHWPGVPNLGDMTTVDWATVPRVDVLTGGTPCQDLSTAGQRAGMTIGTRSNLWVAMREAIAYLRPSLVVWENVRGALNASADSDVESCPGCVGDDAGQSVLRALGRVLGDLAALRFAAEWLTLEAAEIGAPHHRARVFLAAHPAERRVEGQPAAGPGPTELHDQPDRGVALSGRARDATPASGRVDRGRALPTPLAADASGARVRGAGATGAPGLAETINAELTGLDLPIEDGQYPLLPTPAVNDMADNKTVEWWDAWTADLEERLRNGNGHGPTVASVAKELFATPRATAGGSSTENRDSLLGTPTASLEKGAGPPGSPAQQAREARHHPDAQILGLSGLLPTPTTAPDAEAHKGGNPTLGGAVTGISAKTAERFGIKPDAGLLPTPTVVNDTQAYQGGDPTLHGAITGVTPEVADRLNTEPSTGLPVADQAAVADLKAWGKYAHAIARWSLILDRLPPPPIENPDAPRLAPPFVEWMMGLPPGWVTTVPGINRRHQLRALGNGVVPAQAAAALTLLLTRLTITPDEEE